MRRSILAATALTLLATAALAQRAPVLVETPAFRSPQSSEDAMTDVDPELLARCNREAAQKKLTGTKRTTFMNACVEPED